jgi:Family of unknown function (DUF5343)
MNGTTEPRQRPYAPPANVIAVLKRARSRNLPERIDSDFLRLAEVPEPSQRRVTVALRFLGLIDEGGRPTDTLQALAAARDDEYANLLSAAIRDAYKEDFERIDPAEDTHAKIVAAFQPYQPRSQTDRMVMLFLGLCREAGIPVMEAPRERKMKGTSGPRATRSSSRTTERASAAPATPQRQIPSPPPAPSGLLFGVTDDDIALLGDEQFEQVWQALGVVARTRAQAQRQRQRAKEAPSPDSEKGDEDQ